MFVEKLNERDIELLIKTFLKKYNVPYHLENIKHLNTSHSTIWKSNIWGAKIIFEDKSFVQKSNVCAISDFEIRIGTGFYLNPEEPSLFDKDEIEEMFTNFKKFMYKKFGDEYKQAFNENLKKKYESEMIK